jgi:uncharacterized membrane protein
MASNPADTVPDLSRKHSCRVLIKQPIQDRGSHGSISPVRRDVRALYLHDPSPDWMSGTESRCAGWTLGTPTSQASRPRLTGRSQVGSSSHWCSQRVRTSSRAAARSWSRQVRKIGNTRAMTTFPPSTRYDRWLGRSAPTLRRTLVVGSIGLIVAVVLVWFVPWGIAVVAGWDAAAFLFLMSIWPIIVRSDSSRTAQLVSREDPHQASTAAVLLVGASVASLLGVGYALILAGRHSGPLQVLLIGVAVLTVVLSWTVVNTVYTMRYTRQNFMSGDTGLAFGDSERPEAPTYRDFAYVAFTIGMCYSVSDTTIRNRWIRRTVLSHALLSYVFGTAIVGGSVNLIAGLIH